MSTAVEVSAPPELDHLSNPLSDLAWAVLEVEGRAGAVVLALVDEDAIRGLNHRYRGLDEPTDVLSFSYADSADDWPTPGELGEVAVCLAVVQRYAREANSDPGRLLGWTVVHGILHLLGYDHERDDGEMRLHERRLLEELAPLVEALDGSIEDSGR